MIGWTGRPNIVGWRCVDLDNLCARLKMVLAFVVGKRTQAKANLWLHRVAHLTDQRIPFFTSDPLPEYRTALLQVYGRWVQPPRNGNRGRFPQPRRLPPPDLL